MLGGGFFGAPSISSPFAGVRSLVLFAESSCGGLALSKVGRCDLLDCCVMSDQKRTVGSQMMRGVYLCENWAFWAAHFPSSVLSALLWTLGLLSVPCG